MASHTLIVAGPARSGKSGKLLSCYRTALAKGAVVGLRPDGNGSATTGFGETLWIAPTARSVNHVRENLLSAGTPGCFAPNVYTFEAFAQAILDHAADLVRPLYGMARRQLIARLVDDLRSKHKLAYFQAIAHTPGFVDLLSSFLSELKRHEVWPDDFRRACVARGITPKDEDLLDFYDAYQAVLNRRQLFDAEGRFWTARTLLRDGQRRPFERLRLVAVDGFADFTATQHDILEILASYADELIVSLPLERDVDRRRDLFAKPLATLEQLSRRLPAARVEWLDRDRAGDWPAMDRLERHVLGDPREKLVAETLNDDDPRIEILAAARQIGEIQTIAARIKRLLLDGDEPSAASTEPSPRAKVHPQDIVVVFRSTDGVAPLVEEVFAEYGLPFAIDRRPPLAEAPRIKALLALLELDAEDWPFRAALAVLGNNYVAPPAVADRIDAVQAAAERVVRAMQIPSGRAKLLERWRRLARRADESADPAATPQAEAAAEAAADPDDARAQARRRTERARAAAASLGYVETVATALAELPERATPAAWSTALEQLGRSLGMDAVDRRRDLPPTEGNDRKAAPSILDPHSSILPASVDAAAWRRLREVLRAGSRLSEWLEEPEETWSRAQLLAWLAEICATETIPIAGDETGRVRVLSAPAARTLSIPYLFVASLAEHEFPRRARDEVLYHEADRRRLADEGLRLPQRNERASEEMLLFYEIVTRATRRLFLSYPGMNEKAEPLLASPFLRDVERVLPNVAAATTSITNLRPIPRDVAGYSPADRRVLAMHEALRDRPDRLVQLAADRGAGSTVGANLIAALRTNAARKGERFSPMEGLFTTAAAKELLARRYGPERVWSASQFEAYAHCPMRYLFEHVLHLEPPEEIELATDSRQRGLLLHAALAAAHRTINAAARAFAAPGEAVDAFRRGYREQLDALKQQMCRDTPLDDALLDIDAKLLADLLEVYLDQHREYDELPAALRPAHFEVSFGLNVDEDACTDPLSTEVPLVLRDGNEEIRIGGRIDRIDLGADSAAGADEAARAMRFGVVDYKTGNPIAKKARAEQAEDGRRLQLDLYALAVEEVLLAGRAAVGVRSGYWHVTASGFEVWHEMHAEAEGQWQPNESWSTRKERLAQIVFALARGIRQGQFPVYSPDEKCTQFCTFKTICRVHQARSLEKRWPMTRP